MVNIAKIIIPGLTPAVFVAIGAVLGTFVNIPKQVDAALMSVAAGLVTAAFITEAAPGIADPGNTIKFKLSAALGMLGGALLMIGILTLEKSQTKKGSTSNNVWGLIGATTIDFFIDGLLVGQNMKEGEIPNVMLLIATSIESVVLMSSIVIAMQYRNSTKKQIATASIIVSFGSIAGMATGYLGSNYFVNEKKAFITGLTGSVLLWMVARELLPEADKQSGRKLWVPVIWIVGTILGVISDWYIDSKQNNATMLI